MIRKGKPAETLGRKTIGPSLFVWQPVTEEVLGISMGKSERNLSAFFLFFANAQTPENSVWPLIKIKVFYIKLLKISIGTGGILMGKCVKSLAGLVIFSCGKTAYGQWNTSLEYWENAFLDIKVHLSFIAATIIILNYKLIKNLYQKAYFDELTAAKNRVKFKKEIEKLDLENKPALGMMLNIDNFKNINYVYGHSAGDYVLKTIVKRLQEVFGKKSVYRFSGDEFFILHEDTGEEHVELKANKVMEELKKPLDLMGTKIRLFGSIGICSMNNKTKDVSEFLHRANVAMYKAKKSGKGRFVVADDQMVEEFRKYSRLEQEFLRYLQNKELFPYYQPKVELESEEIIGVEALARWVHPLEGFISPAVFVPIAEKNGVVSELDFLIAESAIMALKKWIKTGIVSMDFKLSFNISVKTLEEIDVYTRIDQLLKKYEVSGENIQVEITESVFINDIEKVINNMSLLKENLGISIALDDFTAGHSSLKELGKLGIDTLKFDRSLLQIVKENANRGQKIYSTLVHLSNDMGYISVAEGIEEASESEFLKKEGVKYAQGYYFGKPMPEELLISVLDKKYDEK